MVRVLTFGLRADLMGGIEKFVFTMAGHMKDECTFDYVFLETEASTHQDLIESLGGEVYLIPYYVTHPFKYVYTLYQLFAQLHGKIDVVYVNLFSMVHIFPIVLARLMGYKVMIHAHNNNIQHTSRIYHLIHQMGKRICAQFHCLRLTNSEESAVYMFGKKRGLESVLIYNAIEVSDFAFSAAKRKQVRNQLGISDKTYIVGFSGRLDLQKNPLLVIDGFEQFLLAHPDSFLLMAGDGPLRKRVKAYVKQKGLENFVMMLGQVGNMADLYQAMDIFLLPSLFEGLGIVLVEAQAAGLPCLTTQGKVPAFVSVTPLVYRDELSSTAIVWARHLSLISQKIHQPREAYQAMLQNSSYDIHKEAKRFAGIIKKYVQS